MIHNIFNGIQNGVYSVMNLIMSPFRVEPVWFDSHSCSYILMTCPHD
ncbi:Uncharacterised protein [Enterobacter cloacae]|uniref:Uncharacterized protein n=1 Tax=Enterobacter cloacae TaxID=550 RepID=A0A144VHT8_ENTCL|nr:Uncharacterised protein [Enterobacter cloacae]